MRVHAIMLIVLNRMALCVVKLDTVSVHLHRRIPVKRTSRHPCDVRVHYFLTGAYVFAEKSSTPSTHVSVVVISHNLSHKLFAIFCPENRVGEVE